MIKSLCSLLLGLLTFTAGPVQGQRVVQTINADWKFALYEGDASGNNFDVSKWEDVHVPHTWNAEDATDEQPGYHRGKGWYRKALWVDHLIDGQRVYLYFEGANQLTEVFVNGRFVGKHAGGYTRFSFDVTEWVRPGKNSLAVSVDNSYNPDIPPLSADYTFFGGIYRDVYLVYTSPIQISMSDYATSGVYLNTGTITGAQAEVNARTLLSNATSQDRMVMLETEIVDAKGKRIARSQKKVILKKRTENLETTSSLVVKDPVLWDIDDPYLYKVYSVLKDAKGAVLDRVVNPLGIRTYRFDPNEGFFLNGRYRKLVGTNRHQDYKGQGNALSDEMHIRDIQMIKEMGSNFLRVSHYPQDPVVMNACDQLGLLTSVEIPIVNTVTGSSAFLEDAVQQATEMVLQNFNYPSVIIWAYMNEVLLRPPSFKEGSGERSVYLKQVYRIASAVENRIRHLDSSRYTMIPEHANHNIYREAGISALPRLLGFNLYDGWYGGKLSDFEKRLDKLHTTYPKQPLLITEFGADVDPRLHSFHPERFDFSNEFGERYHEHYLPEILKRKYIVGATVWNFNDFYSEARINAVPHVNSKGLVGLDRKKKDTYFLYQAYLKTAPVVHIVSKEWASRSGASADGQTVVQPLAIYTNAEEVKVLLNGKDLGTWPVRDRVARGNIAFIEGKNVIEAVIKKEGRTYRDRYVANFHAVHVGSDFTSMNILLGSNRYFEDRVANICWIPEQPYTKGGWGYVGGEKALAKTRYGTLPAQDIDILGTDQDPIYQTQRVGLRSFKADLEDGMYAVYLYWAELTSDQKKEALVYNLGNDAIGDTYVNRAFSVRINGVMMDKNMNIAERFGTHRAVVKKYLVSVQGGTGLSVDFGAIASEPILNAIRIVKVY